MLGSYKRGNWFMTYYQAWIALVRNFSFAGLSYSSPTIASAMNNMEPSLTFLLAVIFSFECGSNNSTTLGALTITIYEGSALWASPQSNPPNRPVFVAVFGPLGAVMAALMSAIFLGDTLHIGSVVGAIIIVSGFYAVIWAKSKDGEDHEQDTDRLPSSPSQQTTQLLLSEPSSYSHMWRRIVCLRPKCRGFQT
uniref:WAT1-related protein n=1 Tax=Kalanchoe fedtschenkoi TaxID=63787 RepID=A0A7N0T4V8_KALFE